MSDVGTGALDPAEAVGEDELDVESSVSGGEEDVDEEGTAFYWDNVVKVSSPVLKRAASWHV
jgi:hypothetical protein